MRFKASINYKGTNYCGWQIQPNGLTVQEVIETKLSILLTQEIKVTGCGRTDTGVHARNYVLHFNSKCDLPNNFLFKLNQFLPLDISVISIEAIDEEFHARFSATKRAYNYYINGTKNPFNQEISFHYSLMDKLGLDAMNQACAILLNAEEFAPFCKTDSSAKTMFCNIVECYWTLNPVMNNLEFNISANRFLRGMVRLIVGMMINVGIGKISVKTLQDVMEEQGVMPHSWSVPAKGLFFNKVEY